MISADRLLKAPVTTALIVINIIVFIIETVSGGSDRTDIAIRFGAQYSPFVLEKKQYYRLFTAMFLHFGFIHIMCNMWSLYNIGPTIELVFGKWRYIIIYLGAGLAGNLLTLLIEARRGQFSVSAGASGAVFGLMGAYLVLALLPRFRGYFSLSSILFNIGINVVYGLRARGINMTAHMGGLLGGIVISFLTTLM